MCHLLRGGSRFSLAALALALGGCAEKSRPGGSGRRSLAGVPPVVVATVERKVAPLTLDAIGAVEPMQTAAVRSQVTGQALRVHFQEGQDVRQGDLLFELDARPFRNTVLAAEADVQKFQAQLAHARLQVTRYDTLNRGAMVSQEQFQTIQLSERALAAQVAAAESALATARLQLDYCSIRAPISGRTGGLGVHAGDLVRASDAAVSLVTIHQLSPIAVTFGLPQQHLNRIAEYRAAGVIAVTVTPAGSGETAETGELSFVDNAVDPSTGTVKLKATFANERRRLWPGQFVTVRVTLASPEALVVPAAALQNSQKGQHVFVVAADQTARLRPVTVERLSDGVAVIGQGLQPGETVVTVGQLRVVSGRPVEIKPALMSAVTTEAAAARKRRKAE